MRFPRMPSFTRAALGRATVAIRLSAVLALFGVLVLLSATKADAVIVNVSVPADAGSFPFGINGDTPLAGDWNGNGIDTIGVYRPSDQGFYLSNDNVTTAGSFGFGSPGDLPVTGDWNCDGMVTIGVYRPSTQTFHLSNDNVTAPGTIAFGNPGDLPVIGDWNGDCFDEIGLFRPSTQTFYTTGPTAGTFVYGSPGDTPIAGNWDGIGGDTIGIYRPSTREFHLSNNNATTAGIFPFGNPNDLPLVGDWNGDGVDNIGVYRPSTVTFHLSLNSVGIHKHPTPPNVTLHEHDNEIHVFDRGTSRKLSAHFNGSQAYEPNCDQNRNTGGIRGVEPTRRQVTSPPAGKSAAISYTSIGLGLWRISHSLGS